MNPLDCAPEPVAPRRPLFNRIAAPPELVSRLVRKSLDPALAARSPMPFLSVPSRSAGHPPAVALALALAQEREPS